MLDDDAAVAFLDRPPLFPGHVLVVPPTHVVTLPELDQVGPFFEAVQRVAAAVPAALGAQGTFVAMNNVVSQSVPHLHVHVVPRTKGRSARVLLAPHEIRTGEAAASRRASAANWPNPSVASPTTCLRCTMPCVIQSR